MMNLRFIYMTFVTIGFVSVKAQNAVQIADDDSLMTAHTKISLLYDEKKTVHNNIYAVNSVNADQLSKTISFSLFEAVKGRLSGYDDYLVRGYTSVNQGPVMFLLDGFEISSSFIDNIDIEEIESITVMKDAASTALFGLRAGNGILSIRTKRGYMGKPSVKVEGSYGFNTIMEKPNYYNSYEYTGFYNEALQNDGLPILYSEEERNKYKTGQPFYPSTNWYDETLNKMAPIGKVGLTVQGGSQIIKYFVHANYFTNKIRLRFKNADNGLMADRGVPKGLAIAGSDKKFVWAEARIEGNELIVWHNDIPAPVAVRYAWTASPVASNGANLYNKERFPVSPFRTDDWESFTKNHK